MPAFKDASKRHGLLAELENPHNTAQQYTDKSLQLAPALPICTPPPLEWKPGH